MNDASFHGGNSTCLVSAKYSINKIDVYTRSFLDYRGIFLVVFVLDWTYCFVLSVVWDTERGINVYWLLALFVRVEVYLCVWQDVDDDGEDNDDDDGGGGGNNDGDDDDDGGGGGGGVDDDDGGGGGGDDDDDDGGGGGDDDDDDDDDGGGGGGGGDDDDDL